MKTKDWEKQLSSLARKRFKLLSAVDSAKIMCKGYIQEREREIHRLYNNMVGNNNEI